MTEFKEPKNLKELIIQISERPAMFCGWYDFGRAAAYIEGYQQARSQLLPSEQDLILREFGRWLSEMFDRPKNWAWSAIIQDIYQKDEEAFEHLPKLFEQFCETNQDGFSKH